MLIETWSSDHFYRSFEVYRDSRENGSRVSYGDGVRDNCDKQLTEVHRCGKVTFNGDVCGMSDRVNANELIGCD